MQKLLLLLDRKKSTVHLVQNVAIAIVLVIFVGLVDIYGILPFKIPSFFLTSIEFASEILKVLVGSFLTITTFTFSTIMVVLTTYSSNYTPRVVENFLSNKITMNVLGLFVGGFLYSILSLYMLNMVENDILVISAGVAVVYSIISIIFFVSFIFSVSTQIQESRLIKDLYNKSSNVIDRFVDEHKKYKRSDFIDFAEYKNKKAVYFSENGYLEIIDTNFFLEKDYKNSFRVKLFVKIGDYISNNQMIAEIYFNDDNLDENVEKSIVSMLKVEDKKFVRNDYMFSIQKIVEIALRSMSPAINDPNTARNCIRIIGVLIGKLSKVSGNFSILSDLDASAELVYEDFDFKNDLYFIFFQLINYGKEDLSIVLAILEALQIAIRVSSDTNKKTIIEFSNYVYERVYKNFEHELDRELLLKKLKYIRGYKFS